MSSRASDRAVLALALAMTLVVGCGPSTPAASPDPGPVPACTHPAALNGEPAVWGWADLHTHPATELAFEERLLWGSALQHVDVISPTVLPAIDPPCSVETHHQDSSSPLDRTAHTLIMSMLNQQEQYLHTPIGTVTPRAAHLAAWPNGRDVLHQQMQLSSLRRAYEGGQRVLFASTTDSQVLAQLLKGPLYPDLFLPVAAYDEDSATRQLDRIEEMVRQQSGWMAIAQNATEARDIIRSGRLAVILSLEMDSLSPETVMRLVDRGVRHVIPVHLIDNAEGGTAANGDIFNPESAYMSALFTPSQRLRFFEVERTPDVLFLLPRPLLGASGPGSVPVYANLAPIPYDWYQRLQYDDTCFCSLPSAPSLHAWDQMGHANAHGLSAEGRALVRTLLERGVMVDVSHMGVRSTEDALCTAERLGRPLLASHGGVGPASGPVGSERDLDHAQAVRLANGGGILGLGTGGNFAEQVLFTQNAGTLVTLHTHRRSRALTPEACVASSLYADVAAGCTHPVTITPPAIGTSMQRLDVRFTPGAGGSCASNDRLFAQVTLTQPGTPCGASVPTIVQALFSAESDGTCLASFTMPVEVIAADGAPMCDAATVPRVFGADDVCGAGIVMLDPTDCAANTLTSTIPVASASVVAVDGMGTMHTLATASGSPTWTTLGGGAGIYVRNQLDPTSDPAVMIRIDLVNGGTEIPGAGPSSDGYDVCVRPRACIGAGCTCDALPITSTADDDCAMGWISLNHRGDWPSGAPVDAYLPLPAGVRAGQICGLDLVLVGDGPPITTTFGGVTIDSIHDPISLWANQYDAIERDLFAGERGRIGFGTDMNGLAVQFPVAQASPDEIAIDVNGCTTSHLGRMTVDGEPLRLEDRGLGTYGMLTDVLGTIDAHPSSDLDAATSARVIESMFFSAEQTLRFWERVEGTRASPHVTPDPRCPP